MHTRTATTHGIGYGSDSLVLPYDTAVQLLLEVQQLVTLTLEHLAHRDTRPAAHHIGNIVCGDLLFDERPTTLLAMQLLLGSDNLRLHLLEAAIAYLGHTTIVTLALGAVGLHLELLHELLLLLYLIDESLLGLPLLRELALLGAQGINLLGELCQLSFIFLALDGLALNLQLLQVAGNLIQLFRHRVALHAQLGSRLIHEVDGLVGEETLGDVSAR